MDDLFHVFIITWNFVKLYVLAAWLILKDAIKGHTEYEVPKNVIKKKEVAIVTGGARGIGYEVVKGLLTSGYHVIIASRNELETEEAIIRIKKEHPKAQLEHEQLDLSSFESIKNFATRFQERKLLLQLLVNNAAVMLVPFTHTKDGIEEHFGVNYVGHFLLTELLLDCLKRTNAKGGHPRIVNVASDVHKAGNMFIDVLQPDKRYTAHGAYMKSKLALTMWTYKLQRELLGKGIGVFAVHPGVVNTDLYEHVHPMLQPFKAIIAKFFFKTARQGADSVLFAALSPSLDNTGGKYVDNSSVCNSSQLSYDIIIQDKLWAYTKDLIKLKS